MLSEGWEINHKRVYGPCKEKAGQENQRITRAPERRLAAAVNECWCMDFVSDQLYQRAIRISERPVLGSKNKEIEKGAF